MSLIKKKTFWVILALVVYILITSILIVEQYEVVVVTQFGDPVKVISEPGLKFKLPYPIQNLHVYDKRINTLNPPYLEYLTKDKKNLLIDSFICWRIKNPVEFLQTVTDNYGAEARLTPLIYADLGASLGATPLEAILSTNSENIQTDKLEGAIKERLDATARREFGIEIVTLRIMRINYPDQNKRSVFERMVAERERIATQFRSEGEEESLKIRSTADKDKSEIISEAKRKAEVIKGNADAEAARIYASSFQRHPGFYKFIRTLEAYSKIFNRNSIILIPSDSALVKYLNNPEAL